MDFQYGALLVRFFGLVVPKHDDVLSWLESINFAPDPSDPVANAHQKMHQIRRNGPNSQWDGYWDLDQLMMLPLRVMLAGIVGVPLPRISADRTVVTRGIRFNLSRNGTLLLRLLIFEGEENIVGPVDPLTGEPSVNRRSRKRASHAEAREYRNENPGLFPAPVV